MKEAGRRCQRCDFAWYATPPKGSPGKPRFFDEMGAVWTDGQARMARRTANYDRHLQAQSQWDQCPNCGSRSVKTDKSRAFRATGAIAPQAPRPQPDAGNSPAVPQQRPAPRPEGESGSSVWRRLGTLHGKHWRIIYAVVFGVAPFGSLGDETTYTGGTGANVFKFIAILLACWAVAGFFLALHMRHRAQVHAPGRT